MELANLPKAIVLAATTLGAVSPTTAFAARSDASGGGCDCGGGASETPSASPSDNSGNRSTRNERCGVEKAPGNTAVYYAYTTNAEAKEPTKNRTTVGVGTRQTPAITQGNRSLTTLTPQPNETLVQCATRAMNNLYNAQKLMQQGVGIQTYHKGPKADHQLR
tara:strand:- start:1003 stop:1491 length:489 start_codon:yes stop_codon:yes gene_type:complete